jgi:starch-binding outer membrane protein, SusD/RagB family
MKKTFIQFLLVGAVLVTSTTGCQDAYLNPSAASETQAVNDINGLITLANGLQYRFTTSRAGVLYNTVSASGLSTRELNVLNAGNTDEDQLRIGGLNVTPSNAVLRNLWSQSNLVKANADLILTNVANVTGDAGTKAGLVAYASIFKAMSLGTLATFWQQAPITVGEGAKFSPRSEVYQEAIKILENAATVVAANPPTANFTSRIVSGIDLANTIQALIARYSLFVGDHDKALAAAAKASLTVRSAFTFDDNAASRNPLFDVSFGNRNVTEPFTTFGLPADLRPVAADRRIAFYLQTANTTFNAGRASFFSANTSAIPVYLPGEMLLIQAEANARKGNLAAATTALNAVLTKTNDAWGIGAGLPAYAGANTQEALLTEIFRQRSIELFMAGLKLEDSRRFGRSVGATGERSRTWYPYPLIERDNNKANTPEDPAI